MRRWQGILSDMVRDGNMIKIHVKSGRGVKICGLSSFVRYSPCGFVCL